MVISGVSFLRNLMAGLIMLSKTGSIALLDAKSHLVSINKQKTTLTEKNLISAENILIFLRKGIIQLLKE